MTTDLSMGLPEVDGEYADSQERHQLVGEAERHVQFSTVQTGERLAKGRPTHKIEGRPKICQHERHWYALTI